MPITTSDNKRTSAGYNTEILERMLTSWQHSLGKQKGEAFEVWVAITDTDLMERGALLRVFPKIWLLICQFHLVNSTGNPRAKISIPAPVPARNPHPQPRVRVSGGHRRVSG